MLSITPKQRLSLGSLLIGASLLLFLGIFAWLPVSPKSDHVETNSTALVSQYRGNVTASNTQMLSVPTQTNITISFPSQMNADETVRVTTKVERYIVAGGFVSNPTTGELQLDKKLDPIKTAPSNIEVKLVSSAFEVQGLSIQKEGTPFPLYFTWTITPKKEGTHELLIDLSEIVRDSRLDSSINGKTDVRFGNIAGNLNEGVVLPLKIKVTQFGLPGWIINAGASLPAFLGFVLTYPLFVEWLNKKMKSGRPRTPAQRARH